MTVEVIQATAAHIRVLVQTMRPDDRAEIEGLGCHVRHTMHRLYRDSLWSMVALVDGEVAAAWGLLAGSMLDDVVYPWLFTTPAAERAPVAFYKVAKAEIARMMIGRRMLVTRVAAGYARSIKLFEMLGFQIGPEYAAEPLGLPYRQMVMERGASQFYPVAEQPISTDIALFGGVLAKRHIIPKAGTYVPQHAHTYDHLSILASGGLRAWCDGALLGDFSAPAEIRIPAHTKHVFMALSDGTTFYCTHSEAHFEVSERHELVDSPAPAGDEIVIAHESFATFYRDAQPLFAEHYAEAGGFAGLPLDPNIEMARAMERDGNLLVTTARDASGIVGYIVFLINPCFESKNVRLGFQNIFFVRKGHRGLGPKLRRTAKATLKARGVSMLILRAGVRASGPKQKALFVREGAQDMGSLHYLALN